MTEHLRMLWERLTGSMWFVPAAIVLASIALAFGVITIDARYGDEWDLAEKLPRFFGANAESSRAMLGTIAASMATIAGVTFSITVVAVAQAAGQYTPRVLRSFMRDRGNQATLGAFIGIFVYALIVLRTVRGQDDLTFVPSIATLVAFALVIIGMGVLIYFIHHVTDSLQASTILRRIQHETSEAIDYLFPDNLGEEAEDEEPTERTVEALAAHGWVAIEALDSGYLQTVDNEALLQLACKLEAVIRMCHPVGAFVVRGETLAAVCEPVAVDERLTRRINRIFEIGSNRLITQDAAYGVRQLVDVAVKALSPSVNDISTAVTAIDYIGALLAQISRRRIPSWLRAHDGQLRVIARGPTFVSLVSDAVDDIRRNAGPQVAAWERLINALQTAIGAVRTDARRMVLQQQLALTLDEARRSGVSRNDLQHLRNLAGKAPAGALGTGSAVQ